MPGEDRAHPIEIQSDNEGGAVPPRRTRAQRDAAEIERLKQVSDHCRRPALV